MKFATVGSPSNLLECASSSKLNTPVSTGVKTPLATSFPSWVTISDWVEMEGGGDGVG